MHREALMVAVRVLALGSGCGASSILTPISSSWSAPLSSRYWQILAVQHNPGIGACRIPEALCAVQCEIVPWQLNGWIQGACVCKRMAERCAMERGMAETRGITGRRLAAGSWQQFTFALEGLAAGARRRWQAASRPEK